jgi:hypothetical protein
MTIIIPLPAILSGMVSGFLYFALYQVWIVGVTAPFLPVFLLGITGMMFGRAGITVATAVAGLSVLLLLPFYDAVLIISTRLIPFAIFIRCLMSARLRANPPSFQWTPLGHAITAMSLYSAGFHVLIVGTNSVLYQYVSGTMLANVKRSFSSIDPTMAVTLEGMMNLIPHLLLALDFWIWSLTALAVTIFANFVVRSLGYGQRAKLPMVSYYPPNILLALLGGAAVLGAVTGEHLMMAGQAASILLLIPYFFLGLSEIHTRLRGKQNGAFYIAGVYFMFFLFNIWPLMMVTLFGLLRHVGYYAFSSALPRK